MLIFGMMTFGFGTSFISSVASASPLTSSSQATVTKKIPILVYHHIRHTKPYSPSTWSYKMSVSPKVFEKQMQWLVDHGYTTISLDTFVSIMKGELVGPDKPVVITFDDNNLSQYTIAYPVLKKNNQMAVFYLVTNRLKNKSFISEEQVKEMSSTGMDIQSHTVDHATMNYLSVARMDAELIDSRAVLQALTGKPVRHVAYPSTGQNKTVRERVAKNDYVTGTIMDPRWATQKDDFFKLPRIQMLDTTNLEKLLP